MSPFCRRPDRVSDCSFLISRSSPVFCLFSRYPLDLIAIIRQSRKKAASTSFTQSSNLTNQSSTISSHWKSRRRSTRSDGADDKILHTFCYQQMVYFRCSSFYIPSSTNPTPQDKTIKLWKVFEKSLRVVSESNHHDGQRPLPPPTAPTHLRLPRMAQQDNIIAAVPRKVYSNAHAYHIHSISVNSDQETYISADDLRINLWNLNISDQSFSECTHFLWSALLMGQ